MAETRGYKVAPSSRQQNIDEHWDYQLSKGDKTYQVEVKATKKLDRSDESYQDEWVVIELIAVAKQGSSRFKEEVSFNPLHPKFSLGSGRPGWLYGEANLFAFEQALGFVLVEKEKLTSLVATK